jgi:protein gp37
VSTKIEWTDETWNPVTGCTKVSQGCKNCYAERIFARPYPGRAFTDVRTHADRLDQPLRWKQPRRIFVNSMSDLFHEDIPDDFIFDVFGIMEKAHWHTFQVLTKRPARMLELLGEPVEAGEKAPPSNIWWGVSAEDQATADERILLLQQTTAAVRFLSCEPLLGPIDLTPHLQVGTRGSDGKVRPDIHWVIAGGESGPKARPSHPDWFRSLRDQCATAGVPFFFKQWGEWWEVAHLLQEHGKALEVDADSLEAVEWFDPGDALIAHDGRVFDSPGTIPYDTPCRLMTRLGKKAAGRTLDGRTHDEYPA